MKLEKDLFLAPSLSEILRSMNSQELNSLEFGVIGFDNDAMVKVYNETESRMAGLSTETVIGNDLFNTVAPCMNNFLVAQKFEDSIENNQTLDEILDYVLTLKMKPTRVKLRLISHPELNINYVLILRTS